MTKNPVVYFGPVSTFPSWNWVGADVAECMSQTIAVRFFGKLEDIVDGAVVFWIKSPASDRAAELIRKKRLIVLFFPVDCFRDEEHIRAHNAFIHSARLLCLHSRSLANFFPNSEVKFVEHYNKYGIAAGERNPGNTCLWIGSFQYVPYILKSLVSMQHRPSNVLLLTDAQHVPAKIAAAENARKISLPHFEEYLNNGTAELQTWSEARQREALLSCKIAFDVKYVADFNQYHKPPTKIQKYLCSGIPCAINADVPFLQELSGQVVRLDALSDMESLDNKERADFAVELSARLSLERVSERYRQLIERAMG